LRIGDLDRSYLLLAPPPSTNPAALVVVLHGGGGSPETMIARWADKAREAGLVIAAPKGIGRNGRMGTWNAGGCCGEAMSRQADDIGFIGAIIDDVVTRVRIDPSRVYVTGFSNGGMLTYRVAIALSQRIAAAAVVSGALFGDEVMPQTPVPMLIMHGDQDPVVGFNGGTSPTRFVARAQTMPFQPVQNAVNFWHTANGCTARASTARAGIEIESSGGCRGGADVLFYRITNGGHSWPGSSVKNPLEFGDASGGPVNATNLIWDFFSSHPRIAAQPSVTER
jgi:polyhydroxybutyrate depolymerase